MEKVTVRFGVDIAKHVFAVYGVDQNDKATIRKTIRRQKVLEFFANTPPSIIGIEACGGSQYWARQLAKQGHEVRIVDSRFVIPYRRKGKNDANDAEAICEAIARPGMNNIAVKSEEQQSILMAHKMRFQSIATRTAIINQIHGHLLEFGFVVSKGKNQLKKDLYNVLESPELPTLVYELIHELIAALNHEDERIKRLDRLIDNWVNANDMAKRLKELEGIGSLTASAFVATVGDAKAFKNGRQMAAWLGLVPRQYSSGGKQKLGPITKRGDRYLRTLLIHGARTVLLMSNRGRGRHTEWIESLRERKPDNVVAVAFAAKQARMLWAIMMGKTEYNA